MIQEYNNYTEEDHKVWNLLFKRQEENLADKACAEYLNCLKQLATALHGEAIPNFEALTRLLKETSGWSIEIVPGMIPVDAFFNLLAQRRFCSSTWVRSLENLDYLDEPDIFHDIFGHIPLLVHPTFSRFAEAFGKIGVKYKGHPEIVTQLQRLYWFTIEFGVFKTKGEVKLYGAGIISSYSETLHVLGDKAEVLPFKLQEILEHDFVNTEIQQTYYAIESFEQLFQVIPQLEEHFDKQVAQKTN